MEKKQRGRPEKMSQNDSFNGVTRETLSKDYGVGTKTIQRGGDRKSKTQNGSLNGLTREALSKDYGVGKTTIQRGGDRKSSSQNDYMNERTRESLSKDYGAGKRKFGRPEKRRQNDAINERTRETLSKDYGVGTKTIERDEKFSKAVDTLSALSPTVKSYILSGKAGNIPLENGLYHFYFTRVGGITQMTNEDLAVQAKAGDRQAMAQLWEQNKGLLFTLFRKLAGRAGARMASMGVTWEDVEQCFYLAIVDAVALYEPERGMSFASFLAYPVKSQFFELVGWRTERQKHDPLGQCSSLDEPIDAEDGKQTRGDLEADPRNYQEEAEERIYGEQLHEVLEQCLSSLDNAQAETIRGQFFDGLTAQDMGEKLGCTTEQVRKLKQDGMRKLRSPENLRRLQRFHDETLETGSYHGTGYLAWKYGGCSVEERTILRLEEKLDNNSLSRSAQN